MGLFILLAYPHLLDRSLREGSQTVLLARGGKPNRVRSHSIAWTRHPPLNTKSLRCTLIGMSFTETIKRFERKNKKDILHETPGSVLDNELDCLHQSHGVTMQYRDRIFNRNKLGHWYSSLGQRNVIETRNCGDDTLTATPFLSYHRLPPSGITLLLCVWGLALQVRGQRGLSLQQCWEIPRQDNCRSAELGSVQ